MDYPQVLQFLYNQLPMYQRMGKAAYKANLDNTLALDDYFGNPHKQFKSIHVAGTNGKGSVSHILASILQEAGLKVGLYTSPHLKDFRERIKINGSEIPEKSVIDFVGNNMEIIEKIKPSFFEMTVAMAFYYFAERKVDVAVVEVGLGGRLDSTNILQPLLSIITNIGYDHMEFLGNTIPQIAKEKAGIIKHGIPVVVGETQKETRDIFLKTASSKNARIFFADSYYKADYSLLTLDNYQLFNVYKNNKLEYSNLKTDLLGNYQRKNVITALRAVDVVADQGLNMNREQIYTGLSKVILNTGFFGRWQIIDTEPLVICDTGHNREGLAEVFRQIGNMAYKQLHIIFGVVNDKDLNSILVLLPKDAQYYFTKAGIPRAMDENQLSLEAGKRGINGKAYPTVSMALKSAKSQASGDDLVFVGGSTFVVAEVI
ncbi:MAG: bifunctional folylpolyglutamate synthase/dihydrofolate synthase [Bacteroidales bacterium]|nr:bifunctional folylpolyglutamate synthase/dihydrofolate synthase [Bacteroidales bacterium]